MLYLLYSYCLNAQNCLPFCKNTSSFLDFVSGKLGKKSNKRVSDYSSRRSAAVIMEAAYFNSTVFPFPLPVKLTVIINLKKSEQATTTASTEASFHNRTLQLVAFCEMSAKSISSLPWHEWFSC